MSAGGQTPASAEPVRIVVSAGTSGNLAKALNEALERFTLEPDADEADEELALRRAERAAREVLATEGYFEPVLRFEPNPAKTPRYRLLVELGPLTRVAKVDLEFTGAISQPEFAARAEALRQSWPLPVGSPFRSAQWDEAKSRLLAAVQARDFAAAQIVASSAEVDVEKASANLKFQIDSGPAFRLGPLKIEGLKRFDPSLVERFSPFKPGDPYDRVRLAEFQQLLQNTAYFASAVATVDLNPATADNAPLLIELREAPLRRFAAAVGYGTNNGAHLEVLYRQSITFDQPYPLQTGFRIDQSGGFAYADLFFPPQRSGERDSIGVLYEDSDIQDLQIRRWGTGAVRSQLRGPRDGKNTETQWSINFEHELRKTPLDPQIELNTLSTTYSWIRRNVDDITNPRHGNLLRLEGTVGASGISTDDLFVRGYGRLVQYLPLGDRDVLILR
ncbi:MAG: autotransporter assembly complex protein TamA, partial [Burkholderiaceae bacterium]